MEFKFSDEIHPDDQPGVERDAEERHMEDKRKRFDKSRRHEAAVGSFRCSHCAVAVPISAEMGTSHRNHCNLCLWSKHVDEKSPGDRKSACKFGMKPIGLTLKREGYDKYNGRERLGDVMIVHQCKGCDKFNINRIAADDNTDALMAVFEESSSLSKKIKDELLKQGISVFGESDRELITERIFGK